MPYGYGESQIYHDKAVESYNPGEGERGQNPNPVVIPKASVPTPTGMTPQQQAAITLRQAGAVTSGAFSGTALWDKSPVLYAKKLKQQVSGPAGMVVTEETDRFDPTSKRIGQVDLSKTTVNGLTPFYSTLHPDAVHTGNAKWKAEMKALSEGKTEEEALAIGDKVNEIFDEAIDDRDRGDYTKLEAIMSGENEALNALIPVEWIETATGLKQVKGTGWYTGTPKQEYGMHGAYLGQDPVTGKMYDIEDPTPEILSNLSGGGDGGGGYGYGYGYGGGGGSGGYGYGYGEDEDPFPRGYQRGKVGPGGLLEAVNKLLFRLSGLNKKRGGIVSLLELS